ncbi:MAG TPA: hypothetical protein DEA08_38485, partial [Planctomycetes bacterium]|nr:hypothetical protein [Planctomycetota bacterium]
MIPLAQHDHDAPAASATATLEPPPPPSAAVDLPPLAPPPLKNTTAHLLRRVLQDRPALISDIVAGKELDLRKVVLISLGLSALGGLAIGS